MTDFIVFVLNNWILSLMFIGSLLIVLGAVLNWQWLCDTSRDREKSLSVAIVKQFGEKGYRKVLLVSGLLALTAVSWLLFLAYNA